MKGRVSLADIWLDYRDGVRLDNLYIFLDKLFYYIDHAKLIKCSKEVEDSY